MSIIIKIQLISKHLMASQPTPKKTKLVYHMSHRSGMKTATLVKMANLNYELQLMQPEDSEQPHILYTPSGQLHKQYEIINYIIVQSRELSKTRVLEETQRQAETRETRETNDTAQVPKEASPLLVERINNLESNDPYITAKMYEKLFELRQNFFPLLHEFYKNLLGFVISKRSKYDSMVKKLKMHITNLDKDIKENSEIYSGEYNFLNIIISCQLFVACKFALEEGFRKYKFSLFNKYEKICIKKEFIEIYGKPCLCQQEYIPTKFEEEQPPATGKEVEIPSEVVKLSSNILGGQVDADRNELLYNYFKSTFSHSQNKRQYFPYFWIMFPSLKCSLIEIGQALDENSEINGSVNLNQLHKKIAQRINQDLDYGILGLYQNQNDKRLAIRGLICLGSKSAQQFEASVKKIDTADIQLHKVNQENQKQRKEIQNLWEHTKQNTAQNGVILVQIIPF